MDETFDAFLALSQELAAASSRMFCDAGLCDVGFCDAGTPAAVLVTLVRTAGKGQAVGRRAWALPDGTLRGTLTLGSCATGQLQREIQRTFEEGSSRLLTLQLGSGEDYEFGLTCSGEVTVQLTPDSPSRALWQELAQQRQAGQPLHLLTPLGEQAAPTHLQAPQQGGESLPHFAETSLAGVQVLNEYRPAKPTLLIAGAGPIAAPLSRLAATLGLRVVVTDDQPQRLQPAALPDAHERLLVPTGHDLALPALRPGDGVVVISHDYAHELSVLQRALEWPVSYIALVASRRRGKALLNFMREVGPPAQALTRIRTPAGLDLGLDTPAGIALSVLSEYVQTVQQLGGQQASGQPLSATTSASDLSEPPA